MDDYDKLKAQKNAMLERERENIEAPLRARIAKLKAELSVWHDYFGTRNPLIAKRENNELRAWKECALVIEKELDAQNTAKLLDAKLGESCHKVIAKRVPQLVVENAKLREDKARLEWLFSYEGYSWLFWTIREGNWRKKNGSRAAIDAARKEDPSGRRTKR